MKKLTKEQIEYLFKVRTVLRFFKHQDTLLYTHIVDMMNRDGYTLKEANWLNTTVKNYYISKTNENN